MVGCSPIIGTEHIDVEAATDLGIVIGFGATSESPQVLPRWRERLARLGGPPLR